MVDRDLIALSEDDVVEAERQRKVINFNRKASSLYLSQHRQPIYLVQSPKATLSLLLHILEGLARIRRSMFLPLLCQDLQNLYL